MPNRPPFITYSALADKKHCMRGVHLRVHGADSSETSVVESLTALSPIWPDPPALVLFDFVGASCVEPPPGRQPPESAVIVGDVHAASTELIATTAISGTTPRCLYVRDGAEFPNHRAELYAVGHDALSELPRLFRKTISPILVLNVNEPIDQARARNGGAAATNGWSCLGWKRRPADKKVGLLSNILKLLQLIDKDADTSDLEATLKRDAVLSYRLVAMANAGAFGLAVKVTSLRHAISILV
jgi:hypothetical protein